MHQETNVRACSSRVARWSSNSSIWVQISAVSSLCSDTASSQTWSFRLLTTIISCDGFASSSSKAGAALAGSLGSVGSGSGSGTLFASHGFRLITTIISWNAFASYPSSAGILAAAWQKQPLLAQTLGLVLVLTRHRPPAQLLPPLGHIWNPTMDPPHDLRPRILIFSRFLQAPVKLLHFWGSIFSSSVMCLILFLDTVRGMFSSSRKASFFRSSSLRMSKSHSTGHSNTGFEAMETAVPKLAGRWRHNSLAPMEISAPQKFYSSALCISAVDSMESPFNSKKCSREARKIHGSNRTNLSKYSHFWVLETKNRKHVSIGECPEYPRVNFSLMSLS